MAQTAGLVRSFSSSHLDSANRIHQYLRNQEEGTIDSGNTAQLTRDVTKSTMVIPTAKNLSSPRARSLICKMLVNHDSLQEHESANAVNWFYLCRRLLPLKTESDGNCLLHATLLYVFGVHDRHLVLRRFLEHRLRNDPPREGNFYARWERALKIQMKSFPNSFEIHTMNCELEWSSIVKMASSEPNHGRPGPLYCPLESIHIFVLCNVLARPIIVLCDPVVRSFTGKSIQPSMMDGIYLPVLRHETECEKSPVVLGYESGHFEPLLSSEDLEVLGGSGVSSDAQHCVPLVRANQEPLPVRFLTAVEEDRVEEVKDRYLDLSCIPLPSNMSKANRQVTDVLCAMLSFKAPPAWTIQLMESLYSHIDRESQPELKDVKSGHGMANGKPMCLLSVQGCNRIGLELYNGFCEQCFQRLHPPVNQDIVTTLVPVSQVFENNKQSEEGAVRLERPMLIIQDTCRTRGCPRKGVNTFRGFCYNCYSESFSDDSQVLLATSYEVTNVRDRMSPFVTSGRGQVPFSTGMPVVSPSEQTTVEPTSVSKAAGGMPAMGAANPQRINVPGSLSWRNTKPKTLCSEPGCQENPLPEHNVCANHAKPTQCVMDGCSSPAADNDAGLCSQCFTEQLKQQLAREGDQQLKQHKQPKQEGRSQLHRMEEPAVSSEGNGPFQPPEVYQGFPGRSSPIISGREERPQVVSNAAYRSHKYFDVKCRIAPKGCDRPAEEHKGGYCRICYEAIIYHIQQSGRVQEFGQICPHGKVMDNCPQCSLSLRQGIGYPQVESGYHAPLMGRHSLPDSKLGSQERSLAKRMPANYYENNQMGTEENGRRESTVEHSKTAPESYSYIPCITMGCPGQGRPEYGMLCSQCHAVKGRKSLPRGGLGLQRCPTHNCSFFGSPEYGGLCSQCFVEKTRLSSYQDRPERSMGSRGMSTVASQRDLTSVEKVTDVGAVIGQGELCRRPGCEMFGSREFDGFCSQCGYTEQPVEDYTLIGWSKGEKRH